jgi:hypothetical protein
MDNMHWTYTRGRKFFTGFEWAILGLNALGMGLSAATAPRPHKPEQPRRTEQEEALKRRSDRLNDIRHERHLQQTRGKSAIGVVELLDHARMGASIDEDARNRQALIRGQSRNVRTEDKEEL